MALGSLGTDTGGSIRIPSALSGTVGLKPTYGRVSGTGVIPLAWSFDTFGPMTRCVEDAALLLEVISGIDREDPRTRLAPEPGYTSRGLGGGIRGFRIGIPSSAFDRTDPEIENLVRAALGKLEALGARLIPLDLPGVDRHEEVFSAIAGFEVLSWHRRYLDETPEAYGEATRVRIERGSQVTPERYLAAQRERMKLQAEVQECFESVDLFALPASPVPAPKVGEDPVTILGSKEPVLGALTRPHRLFSITGVPAISVPCGWTGSGLPAGLQLAGAAFDEARVLQAAWAYEQDTLWRPHRGPA
jgi:Asp-tRNA(Asn)/Glu-tRNA(Gln) amidotransferase A subunit family amidase